MPDGEDADRWLWNHKEQPANERMAEKRFVGWLVLDTWSSGRPCQTFVR